MTPPAWTTWPTPAGRGLSLPRLRRSASLGAQAPPPLGVRGLSSADLDHRGTVMHGTRTSLRLWFWAAYLVATHTPGISAAQLQRQFGISRYETAWLILQKLRRAMVAPEREPLRGEVEVDETFVGGHHDGRRGGRQRDGKALVGVIVESVAKARAGCASRFYPTPAATPSPDWWRNVSPPVRSSTPTAGRGTASSPPPAIGMSPVPSGAISLTPRSSYLAPIALPPT